MKDDYKERLARGEWRAMLHAYGHPGALERVAAERDEAQRVADLCGRQQPYQGALNALRPHCDAHLRSEIDRLTQELDHCRETGERLRGAVIHTCGGPFGPNQQYDSYCELCPCYPGGCPVFDEEP